LLAIVAGDDKVADADASRRLLKEIAPEFLTEHYYPGNFHENFNEINREEVFERMVEWCEARIV
jgi:alpha-beta hydrolase superfamily lysophospholipase